MNGETQEIQPGLSLAGLERIEMMSSPDRRVFDAPENIASSRARGLPELRIRPQTKQTCVIVGGGRSILQFEDKLRELYEAGAYFLSVNKVHDWLIERGMIPHGHMVFEVGPIMDELSLNLHEDVEYFVCSLCSPETFDCFDGFKVTVWNANTPDPLVQAAYNPRSHVIDGGGTTMSRAIPAMIVKGHREFKMFGAESSFEDDSHFNGTPDHAKDVIEVIAQAPDGNRAFKTVHYLAMQAEEMKCIFKAFHFMFRCKFYGDGLLPFVHRTMFPDQYQEA